MPTVLDPEFLLARAPGLDRADYPGDLGTMDMNLSALEHIARTSLEQGIHSDHPRLMKELAEQAIAAGHGGHSYLSLLEIFRKKARTH